MDAERPQSENDRSSGQQPEQPTLKASVTCDDSDGNCHSDSDDVFASEDQRHN